MKPVFKRLVLWGLLMMVPSVSLGADPKMPVKKSTGPSGAITLQKKAGGVLTLREVIAQVLLHNPELEAFSLEVRAREARALQAGLYKNPNILFDVQDVLGSGGFRKVQSSQTTIVLSQVIELGGKRTKREKAALSHKDLAFWDYETARMNILTQVAKAYTDALTAQEKMKLARELVKLSQNSYNAVKARVTAGKVSPIHEVKAQVALSTTQIQLQQADNNLKAAYRRLASFWGSMTPRFKKVIGTPVPDRSRPAVQHACGTNAEQPRSRPLGGGDGATHRGGRSGTSQRRSQPQGRCRGTLVRGDQRQLLRR